jgi:thiol-disulfide isomerase/thioredoxin
MKKNKQLKILVIVLGVICIAALGYWFQDKNKPGAYDAFAKCLGDKGAKFYGAFWCPHCQAQKGIFGKSKAFLPYVECSTPDSSGQTDICKEKKIQSYPTWEFKTATGTELVTGEKTVDELAAKTGCVK